MSLSDAIGPEWLCHCGAPALITYDGFTTGMCEECELSGCSHSHCEASLGFNHE